MTPFGNAAVEIDLEALRRNYHNTNRSLHRDTRVIASVKADGYGCGAVEVSRVFEDLGAFALATGNIREAEAIRAAGVKLPIVLFSSYLPENVPELLQHQFIPTVHDLAIAKAISQASRAVRSVYVKVDAGFGRLGLPIADAQTAIEKICKMPNVKIDGIYTHVPFGTRTGIEWANGRLKTFDKLVSSLAKAGIDIPLSQARGSSCVLAGLNDSCNAVCIGHAYYGLSPFSEMGVGNGPALSAVARSLKTRLIQVTHHGQGSDIGIARHYNLERGRTTGVAPIGVSNGFPRLAQGATPQVTIRGCRVPIIGVSLEHMTFDLDGVEDARIGDEVVVFGGLNEGEFDLTEFAALLGRGASEVLQMMAGRIDRHYL